MASGKWFYSRAHLTVQGGAGAARRPGKRASRKSWCFRPEQQDVKQTNKQTHSQERYQKPTAADDIISMALAFLSLPLCSPALPPPSSWPARSALTAPTTLPSVSCLPYYSDTIFSPLVSIYIFFSFPTIGSL